MPSEKILNAKKDVVAALVADFKDAKSFVFVRALLFKAPNFDI